MTKIRVQNRTGMSIIVSAGDGKLLAPRKIYVDHAGTLWVKNILGKQRRLDEVIDQYNVENLLYPQKEPRND